MLHLEEPLRGELRLDRHVRALREAHLVVVVFHLLHQSGVLEVDSNLLTHVHTILTDIQTGSLRDRTVIVEDVDGLKMVLQTQHVVVDIVGGRHFQTARTELDIDISILNDGYDAVHQRYDDMQSLEPCVLHILGVDAHRRVAHDGLRTGRGHHCIIAFGILVHDVALGFAFDLGLVVGGYIIFQIIEFGMLILVDHLLIGERRLGLRVPVDHAHAPIDQSFAIEIHEDVDDTLRARLVHRERGAVPVAGATKLTELLEDDATVLMGPVPGMFEELFTGEVGLFDTLLSKFANDLSLRSDGGVVSARHPAGVLALHTGTAYENILNGVVEHVAHMEHTCHVGWGNDHGVRLAAIGVRREKLVVKPILIPFRLYLIRVVLTC